MRQLGCVRWFFLFVCSLHCFAQDSMGFKNGLVTPKDEKVAAVQLGSLAGSTTDVSAFSPSPTVTTMERSSVSGEGGAAVLGGIQVFTLSFDDLGGEFLIGNFYDNIGVQFDSHWSSLLQENLGGSGRFCNNPSGGYAAIWDGPDNAIINFNFGGLGFVNRIDVWYASNSRHPDSPNPQGSGFVIYNNFNGLGNPLAVVNFPNEIQGGPKGCHYSAWFPDGINFLNAAYSIRFFGQAEHVLIDDLTFYAQEIVNLEAQQNPISVPEGNSTELRVRLNSVPANGTINVDVDRFSGDGDINPNVGSPAFVFTESNWSVFQSATISASEDSDQNNGSAVLLSARRGGTGNSSVGGSSGSVVLPVEVTANEVDDDVTLTMAVSPVGLPSSATQPPAGSQTNIDLNSDLPFEVTATPPTGFLFSSFQTSPGGIGITAPVANGSGGYESQITSIPAGVNPTVTAVFVADTEVSLTVESLPSNGGTIQVGANPPTQSGTFQIPLGTNVNLLATPAATYEFDDWQVLSGDFGAIANLNDPSTTVNADVDTSIRANFSLAPPGQLSWVISPSSLTVAEGEVGSVQISLSEAPTSNVTFSVNPDGTSSPELDVDGTSTFTIPSGSSGSVTVSIRADEDDFDTQNGQAFFDVQKISGTQTIPDSGFNATSDDDDITLDLSPLDPDQGTTSPSSPLVLDSAGPNSDMPYTITASPNQGLIFFAWNIVNNPDNFTLTPPDIDQNGVATSEVSATSDIIMMAEFAPDDLQFIATPNPVNVPEGGSNLVSITLTQPPQPAGQGRTVIAKVTSASGDGDLTVVNEGQTFTFTDANWNDPSAWVNTFQASQDGDTSNGQRTFFVEQDGGTSVDLVPDLALIAVEIDDDEAGGNILVNPSALTIEADDRDMFLVRLSAQPDGPVEVKIRDNGPDPFNLVYPLNATGTFAPLTFDATNWNVAQTITMYCSEFADIHLDPGETQLVNFLIEQVGGTGGSFAANPVSVTATRSDGNASLFVEPGVVSIEVDETGYIAVKLTDPPNSSQLSVSINYSGDAGVDITDPTGNPALLTFNQSNYDSFQFVDLIGTSEGTGMVSIDWHSGDPMLDSEFVEINVSDDQPRLVVAPESLEISSGDQGAFTVSLSNPPTTDVTVSLTTSGGGDLSIVSPASGQLVFTQANYNQPQSVTVLGEMAGSGSVTVAQVAGTPTIESVSVPVTVNSSGDIDAIVNPTTLTFDAQQSESFTVVLSEQPDTNIVLSLVASDTSGSPNVEIVQPTSGQLTFTPSNWNNPQSVIVTASSSGFGQVSVSYLSGTPMVTGAIVTIVVDAAPCAGTITVTPFITDLAEGESGTIQVSQTNNYGLNRTLNIGSTDPAAASFDVISQITVPSGQTVNVTVSALEDLNHVDENVLFVVEQPGGVSPPCGFSPKSFRLRSTDDDYQLVLATAGDDGSSTTDPAPNTTWIVDTTTFSAGNYFDVLAIPGGAYQFSHWTGDTHILGGSPDPVFDPNPLILIDGPNPAMTDVNLTANFIFLDPDLDEELDAFIDDMLHEIEVACGLGAANFFEQFLADPNRTGTMGTGRILPHSGQEVREETDLVLAGRDHPTNLRISRRHVTRKNVANSPFGPAWSFNYRHTFIEDGNGDLLVNTIGREDRFVEETAGSSWLGSGGRFERLAYNGKELVMRAHTGTEMVFYTEGAPGSGKFRGILARIQSPNMNELRFEYEKGSDMMARRITRIVDSYGRNIDFVYGPQGDSQWVTEIRDLTDPDNPRVVTYSYDPQGRLLSVRSPTVTSTNGFNDFPNGKVKTYTYHGHPDSRLTNALTSITFPNQTASGSAVARYAWSYEDSDPNHPLFGYVKDHAYGDSTAPVALQAGGTFHYDYHVVNGGNGVNDVSMRPTVIDRSGTATELSYNRRGLLLEQSIFESESGKTEATYTRSFEYNDNGDLKEAREPFNQSSGTGFTREEHPSAAVPRHMQLQERVREVVPDQRFSDQSVIRTEHTYEPIFNKYFRVVDPRGLDDPIQPSFPPSAVSTYRLYDYMEDLTASINYFAPKLGLSAQSLTQLFVDAGIPQFLKQEYGVDALAGDTVDINGDGIVSDRCGNLIHVIYPTVQLPDQAALIGLELQQRATESYWYNHFGQMVRHVDCEGNASITEYFPANDVAGLNGSTGSSAYGDGGGYPARKIEDAEHLPGANSGHDLVPNARTTTYQYTAQGPFPRNLRGFPSAIVDARGIKHTMLVNELDQVIKSTRAASVAGSPEVGLIPFNYRSRTKYDHNDNIIEQSVRNLATLDGGGPNFYFTSFTFDLLDQLRSETLDSRGGGLAIRTTYKYDESQNLIEQVSAAGSADETVTTWVYDERDLVVSQTRGATGDPLLGEVATITHEYDENGNRVRTYDADGGHTTRFEYDGFDRLRVTTNRVGTQTFKTYDAAGNTVAVAVYGNVDDQDVIGSVALLGKTETSYDERRRPYQTDQLLFHYEGLEFGSIDPGQLNPAVQDGVGRVRRLTLFDRLGRAVGLVDPDADLSESRFDGLGRVVETIDALDNRMEMQYDPNHNLIEVTETEHGPTVIIGSNGEQFVTSQRFDALNRLVESTDPGGQSTLFEYDSRDNLVRQIDELGNHVEYRHDGINRVLNHTVYLKLGGIGASAADYDELIRYETVWDQQHRVAQRNDDKDNATLYHYDDLNRMIRRVYADGDEESWLYNGDGEMRQHFNRNGVGERWLHDAGGRATQVVVQAFGPGLLGTTVKRWSYDGLDRILFAFDNNTGSFGQQGADDDDVTCLYRYDSLSRPILEVQAVGVAESQKPLQFGRRTLLEWQGDRRMKAITYPDGRRVDRQHDSLDRLSELSEGHAVIASFDYMGPARDLRITYGNGTSLNKRHPLGLPTTIGYGYDENRRSLNHRWERSNGEMITHYVDAYNGPGEVGTNRRISELNYHIGEIHNWSLDSAYRAVEFSRDRSIASTRELDGADKMTAYFEQGVDRLPIVDGGVPAGMGLNQYSSLDGQQRSYDDNANLADNGDLQFTFDYANRLVLVEDAAGETIAEYAYSADNRRVLKVTPDETLRYVYNGWQVLEERDERGVLLRQYVDGRDVDDHIQLRLVGNGSFFNGTVSGEDFRVIHESNALRGWDTDELVGFELSLLVEQEPQLFQITGNTSVSVDGIITNSYTLASDPVEVSPGDPFGIHLPGIPGTGSKYIYYHCNAAGWVAAMTDGGGSIAEFTSYDWLGETHLLDATTHTDITASGSTVENAYFFQGRRFDWETGLYYFRNRYYDPQTGEFLSFDPMGNWHHGQGNGYAAFAGDPWNHRDPMGLETFYGFHIPFTDNDDIEVGNELVQVLVDFNRGAADNLTFGLTRYGREAIWGEDGQVLDENAYFKGELFETAVEITLTGGSAAMKSAARRAVTKKIESSVARSITTAATREAREQAASRLVRGNLRSQARRRTAGSFAADGAVHHRYPLLGHPNGAHNLFPTMGLPRLANWAGNLVRAQGARHTLMHETMYWSEKGIRFMMYEFAAARAAYLAWRKTDCNPSVGSQ